MNSRALIVVLMLCAFFIASSTALGEPLSSAKVTVRDAVFSVEVAATQEQRARGLQGRMDLCEACGMLFVFEEPRPVAFWMKDTPRPLSIAFIDANGVIFDIQDMEPMSVESHFSRGPALMALEVNRGAFLKHGIGIGCKVRVEWDEGTFWPQ